MGLDLASIRGIAVWNVVFHDRDAGSWWERFCKRGYRHCAAFGWDSEEALWVVVDPTNLFLSIEVYDDLGLLKWRQAQLATETVIVQIEVQADRSLKMRWGYWCTIVVKALLGLDSGAFRPETLYRHLLDRGARKVFGYENASSSRPGG